MGIGDRLRKTRKYFGLSQVEFASAIGLKQGSYSDVERGRNKSLSISTIENIARNFNLVNIDWLLTGNGDMLKSLEIDLNEPIGTDALRDVIKMLEKDKEELKNENQILKNELLECRKKLIELLDKK